MSNQAITPRDQMAASIMSSLILDIDKKATGYQKEEEIKTGKSKGMKKKILVTAEEHFDELIDAAAKKAYKVADALASAGKAK